MSDHDHVKAEALAELAADEPPLKLSPLVVHRKKIILGGIGAAGLLLLLLGLLIGLGLRAAQRVGFKKEIVSLHVALEDTRDTAKELKGKLDDAKASRVAVTAELDATKAQLASAVAAASEAQAALAGVQASAVASVPAVAAKTAEGKVAEVKASGPSYLKFGNGNCVLEVGAKKDPLSLVRCMNNAKKPE